MCKKLGALTLSLLLILSLLAGCGAAAPGETHASPSPALPEAGRPGVFDYAAVPAYEGEAWVAVNDNVPFFDPSEYPEESFEEYAPLDALGRCGAAMASVGVDLMPTEERGSIGMVKPTGWQTVKYDFVDGKYLYNRCHLIGFQLTAENANRSNLITGTRYLNIQGMLPFENMVADFVKESEEHVLYRVTPVFVDEELVARGVLMEGYSLEDQGDSIEFCVFAYNVQPGVEIDYATGSSRAADAPSEGSAEEGHYILNTGSKKFHLPTCASVDQMKKSSRQDYTGSRESLLADGYTPCKRCNP